MLVECVIHVERSIQKHVKSIHIVLTHVCLATQL